MTHLITDDAGRRIVAAEFQRDGVTEMIRAALFVLSAGAINSALLLQRSANAQHPNGLANSSGAVGRRYMNHNTSCLMGLLPFTVNDTRFPKTLTLNDFYAAGPGRPHALGNIQMLGNIQEPMLRSAVPQLPGWIGRPLARHSVDWLVMTEDLPHADSRVRLLPDGRTQLDWRRTNMATHAAFVRQTKTLLREIGFSAALNPALTVAAQALRVGARLKTRLSDF